MIELMSQKGVISDCTGGDVIWRAVSQQQSVRNLDTQMVSQVFEIEHCWFIHD